MDSIPTESTHTKPGQIKITKNSDVMENLIEDLNFRPEPESLEKKDRKTHLLLSATLRKSATFGLYQTVLQEQGSNDVFLPFECLPEENDRLNCLFSTFRDGGNIGSIMVSDPFKFIAVEQADTLTERAKNSGAVNILVKDGAKVIGDNLDGLAFQKTMNEESVHFTGKRVLFFGCGGVSTAISLAIQPDVDMIGLCDVDTQRMHTLYKRIKKINDNLAIQMFLPNGVRNFSSYDILYNGTGLGKAQREGETPLHKNDLTNAQMFIDAIYAPPMTPFLERGEYEGARTINGLGHMMGSTALHCSIICNRKIDIEDVRRAARSLDRSKSNTR